MSGSTYLPSVRLALCSMAAILLATCLALPSQAEPLKIAEIQHEGDVDFEQEVLPILRKNCLACHNASDAEGDLVLETPEQIKTGGFEGAAVVPGKADESLLLMLASHARESFMPPPDNEVGAKHLTPNELGLIKLWINQGAKGEVTGLGGPIAWQPLPAGLNPIYAAVIDADGQIAAASRANQIFIYHVPSKRLLGRLTDPSMIEQELYSKPGVAHLDMVQSLAIHPSGNLLASGGYKTIKLWKRPQNVRLREIKDLAQPTAMEVSSNGKLYAVPQENGEIQLIDATNGSLTKKLTGHGGPATDVKFNAEGTQLLSGSADKTIRLWSIDEGKQLAQLETPAEVNAVAWVDGGKHLVSAGANNSIYTWANPLLESEEPKEEAAKKENEENAEEEKAEEEAGPQPVKELKGHSQPVTSLANVPGEPTQIVSGSADGNLHQWDALDGKQIRTMNHGGPVVSVAVRADGKRFASASSNNTAKLWNAENGEEVAEIKGSPASRLHAGTIDREVALAKQRVENHKQDLEQAEKRKKSEEENQEKAMETLKTSEEEFKKKQEAAKEPIAEKEAADKELETAQAQFSKAEEAKQKAEEELKKAEEALNKAKEELSKASDDQKEAKQQEVKQAEEQRQKADEAKQAADKEFKEKQDMVKDAENKVKKADDPASKATEERNAAKRAFEAAERSVERAAISVKKATDAVPEAQQALKAREEAQATAEKSKEEAQKAIGESEKPLSSVAFSPDGAWLATGGEDQTIRLWDAETGAAFQSIAGQQAAISSLTFAPGGQLISLGANNQANVWEVASPWKLVRTIGGLDKTDLADRVTALAFSYDGKLLASGGGEPSRSGELKIWNVADGALVKDIPDAHSDTIFDVEFSRDDQYLASSGADRFLKVFEVPSGEFLKSFEGHTHHVMGVSWQADGRVLASSGADQVVKLWNFHTGDQNRTISGYKKEVTSVRFVGIKEEILTGSGDQSVTIKRVSNGRNIESFGGVDDFIYAVDSSDDGNTIIAGGEASVLRVWRENGDSVVNFEPPADPEQTASTESGE